MSPPASKHGANGAKRPLLTIKMGGTNKTDPAPPDADDAPRRVSPTEKSKAKKSRTSGESRVKSPLKKQVKTKTTKKNERRRGEDEDDEEESGDEGVDEESGNEDNVHVQMPYIPAPTHGADGRALPSVETMNVNFMRNLLKGRGRRTGDGREGEGERERQGQDVYSLARRHLDSMRGMTAMTMMEKRASKGKEKEEKNTLHVKSNLHTKEQRKARTYPYPATNTGFDFDPRSASAPASASPQDPAAGNDIDISDSAALGDGNGSRVTLSGSGSGSRDGTETETGAGTNSERTARNCSTVSHARHASHPSETNGRMGADIDIDINDADERVDGAEILMGMGMQMQRGDDDDDGVMGQRNEKEKDEPELKKGRVEFEKERLDLAGILAGMARGA